MTHRASGSRRVIARAWLLPLLAFSSVLAATYLGFLSRSVAHDFIAWWPVWLVLVTLVFVARGRRWGRVRVPALVAVLWLAVAGIFVAGHVLGWAAMPSASTNLKGPQAGAASTGAVSARIEGRLEVGSGESGFLYAVEPLRRGGDIGPPVATEQLQGPSIAVALHPIDDPGLYTFAGWKLDLDESPVWSLSLGGEIEADLSRMRLSALQLDGEGEVELGEATDTVVVTVSGDFEIVVPRRSPAHVVGEAVVPPGWEADNQGYGSPTPGEGWVISVGEGATVTVLETSSEAAGSSGA